MKPWTISDLKGVVPIFRCDEWSAIPFTERDIGATRTRVPSVTSSQSRGVQPFADDSGAVGSFFREQQRSLARKIRSGVTMHAALAQLCCALEAKAEGGFIASILLLDRSGMRLRHGAAPTLPAEYNKAIDGIAIGASVGSCGTAAYLGHPIYVADIAHDPLWADFKDLALKHGLRACWSVPIEDEDGTVIGTFAIYHCQVRSPTPRERQLIDAAGKTAAILIQLAGAEG